MGARMRVCVASNSPPPLSLSLFLFLFLSLSLFLYFYFLLSLARGCMAAFALHHRHLDGNQIASIPSGVFTRLSNIRYLYVLLKPRAADVLFFCQCLKIRFLPAVLEFRDDRQVAKGTIVTFLLHYGLQNRRERV